MFRKSVKELREVLQGNLRALGLETPLLQRRLIGKWPEVAGEFVARRTLSISVENQTLVVRLSSPAIRSDLYMRRQSLVERLNASVGSQVIADIRFY